MDNEIISNKHIHVLSTILIGLGHSYFISSRIPKGLLRLISLFPILVLFTILPIYLPPAVLTVGLVFSVTWQANSRLILFALGKGPLSMSEQSLCNFILYSTIPIRNPTSKLPNPTRKPPNLGLEALVLAIDTAIIAKYNQELHPQILIMCCCVFIFLGMDCSWTCSKFVFHALVGLELEPIFDTPYLSTSLQNFWSKRWNLIVTNLLGKIVYKPVRSALGHDELAQVPAIFATFLASGLLHELLYYCITRRNPSWEMTTYFVFHGVCVLLELAVKKAYKGRLRIPPVVSVPVTVGFWSLTVVWLLAPLMIRDGVDAMLVKELSGVMDFFWKGISFVLY